MPLFPDRNSSCPLEKESGRGTSMKPLAEAGGATSASAATMKIAMSAARRVILSPGIPRATMLLLCMVRKSVPSAPGR